MSSNILPLQEISIRDLFLTSEYCYEIPVYQRNYAWEQEEIKALLQDIYDKYDSNKDSNYYIGTLVSYRQGTDVYEIIDGQQRLTTICIILGVLYDLQRLDVQMKSRLTFKARKKSDAAIQNIPYSRNKKPNSVSIGSTSISQGYLYAKEKLEELIGYLNDSTANFVEFLLEKVHLIHYFVPSDIDLNHYFEIMNSRGKQLEKHEIIKAKIIKIFSDNNEERSSVNEVWNACSRMNHYIQSILHKIKNNPKSQSTCATEIFGNTLEDCQCPDIIEIIAKYIKHDNNINPLSPVPLKDILKNNNQQNISDSKNKSYEADRFYSVIDFPNFLLIVLKITTIHQNKKHSVSLDDKDLLREFEYFLSDKWSDTDNLKDRTKRFLTNLIKAKYFLDNFIVHHDFEKGDEKSNPWVLKKTVIKDNELEIINLSSEDKKIQDELCQLLSMFEVTYSARQRKNYLFYCLFYLINNYDTKKQEALKDYLRFLQNLAYYYFHYFYLTDVNTEQDESDDPRPVSLPKNFDDCILGVLENLASEEFRDEHKPRSPDDFKAIYGDGCTRASNSENYSKLPLFIFNYLDYRIWKLYVTSRSNDSDKNSFYEFVCYSKTSTKFFFERFSKFQFSNTRKSLEHFLPQTNVNADKINDYDTIINCLGNYAMIGSRANSSGSNRDPKAKIYHYLDNSRKIDPISVSSLKFLIMMEICQQKNWDQHQIQKHQNVMLKILFEDTGLPGETS